MEHDKKILLSLAKKVLSASDDTMEVLRKTMACNTKTIERASKNIKDPSPLQSTQVAMTHYLPISIDYEWAIKNNVPDEYIKSKRGDIIRDMHRSDRILCRLDTVSWAIEHVKVTENDEKSQKTLWAQHDKLVLNFNEIEWTDHIKFGNVNMERKPVATSEALVEIPRSERNHVLKLLFVPSRAAEPNTLLKRKVNELAEKLGTFEVTMPFMRQVRIAADFMDTRVRTIPLEHGTAEELIPHRHAFSQNYFQLGYRWKGGDNRTNKHTENLKEIGLITFQLMRDISENNIGSLISSIRSSTLYGVEVYSLLLKERSETVGVRVLKTLLAIEFSSENSYQSINFSVTKGNLTSPTPTHYNGHTFTIRSGVETINYQYRTVRGSMVHGNGRIVSITANVNASKEDIIYVLTSMAVFANCNYYDIPHRNSGVKTDKWLKNNAMINFDYIYEYDNLKNTIKNAEGPCKLGKVNLMDETSYDPGALALGKLKYEKGKWVILTESMKLESKGYTKRRLPEGFRVNHCAYLPFWPDLRGLGETIRFLTSHPDYVNDLWVREDFVSITGFLKTRIIPKEDILAIGNTAYEILKEAIKCGKLNQTTRAFLLCFANKSKVTTPGKMEFSYAGHKLNLFDLAVNNMVNGQRELSIGSLSVGRVDTFEETISLLLPNYKIGISKDEMYPLVYINDIPSLPKGNYRFYHNGSIYYAKWSVDEDYKTSSTIMRFLKEQPKEPLSTKRKNSEGGDDPHSSKRNKVDDEFSLDYMDDFDDDLF